MAGEGQGGGAGAGGATGGTGLDQGQAAQVAAALEGFDPGQLDTQKTADGKDEKTEEKLDAEGKPIEGEQEPEETEEEDADKPKESPEVKALRDQLTALEAKLAAIAAPKQAETAKETPVDKTFFIATQEEMDRVLDKPENMNELLVKVHNRAVESVIKHIPAIISNMIETQVTMRGSVTKFYEENKDLVPHKQYVGFVVNELVGKHPDWDMNKVFTELPKEVRKRIGLKQQAEEKKQQKQRGGFPPRGSGARPPAKQGSDKPTGTEAEIADLITN